MNDLMQKFIDTLQAKGDTCIVIVPKNITTKLELLNSIGSQLRFPANFGRNWDAFDESIDDLEWVEEKNILIIHEEFPKIPAKDFNIYFEILRDASDFWRKDGRKTFAVLFL